jgi:hypothetical protein
LGQRVDQSRRAFGSDNRIGMSIERHDQRQGLMLTGISRSLSNDLLMPQVHAIKKAYGQADFTSGVAQLAKAMDGFHKTSKVLLAFTCQPA